MGELASPSSRNADAIHLESNVFIYLRPSGRSRKNPFFQNNLSNATRIFVKSSNAKRLFEKIFKMLIFKINKIEFLMFKIDLMIILYPHFLEKSKWTICFYSKNRWFNTFNFGIMPKLKTDMSVILIDIFWFSFENHGHISFQFRNYAEIHCKSFIS